MMSGNASAEQANPNEDHQEEHGKVDSCGGCEILKGQVAHWTARIIALEERLQEPPFRRDPSFSDMRFVDSILGSVYLPAIPPSTPITRSISLEEHNLFYQVDSCGGCEILKGQVAHWTARIIALEERSQEPPFRGDPSFSDMRFVDSILGSVYLPAIPPSTPITRSISLEEHNLFYQVDSCGGCEILKGQVAHWTARIIALEERSQEPPFRGDPSFSDMRFVDSILGSVYLPAIPPSTPITRSISLEEHNLFYQNLIQQLQSPQELRTPVQELPRKQEKARGSAKYRPPIESPTKIQEEELLPEAPMDQRQQTPLLEQEQMDNTEEEEQGAKEKANEREANHQVATPQNVPCFPSTPISSQQRMKLGPEASVIDDNGVIINFLTNLIQQLQSPQELRTPVQELPRKQEKARGSAEYRPPIETPTKILEEELLPEMELQALIITTYAVIEHIPTHFMERCECPICYAPEEPEASIQHQQQTQIEEHIQQQEDITAASPVFAEADEQNQGVESVNEAGEQESFPKDQKQEVQKKKQLKKKAVERRTISHKKRKAKAQAKKKILKYFRESQ